MRLLREGEQIWFEGPVTENRPHQHHAMQIVWSPDDEPAELTWAGGMLRASIIVIDGGQRHALHMPTGVGCLIEQQSPIARKIRARWLAAEPVAAGPLVSATPTLGREAELLAALAPTGRSLDVLDPRVREILAWMDALERARQWPGVSLEQALARVHLSRSRFLHLFSEQLGTPWRTYLTWRRALVATTLAVSGASLTRAAHLAGYADSAHLSRQFQGLFGFAPSSLIKVSQFVQS